VEGLQQPLPFFERFGQSELFTRIGIEMFTFTYDNDDDDDDDDNDDDDNDDDNTFKFYFKSVIYNS